MIKYECEKDEDNGGMSRETPDVRIMVNGEVLKQVKKFKYWGQWITDDGRCI